MKLKEVFLAWLQKESTKLWLGVIAYTVMMAGFLKLFIYGNNVNITAFGVDGITQIKGFLIMLVAVSLMATTTWPLWKSQIQPRLHRRKSYLRARNQRW